MNKESNHNLGAFALIAGCILLILLAFIIWMRRSPKPLIVHPVPTPSPYSPTSPLPSPEPNLTPAITRKVSQVALSAQDSVASEEPVAPEGWQYAGETIIIETKPDGEVVWLTLPAGLKAHKTEQWSPDCGDYLGRIIPCRKGIWVISVCQKEVSGPGKGSDFLKSHHDPDPSCEFDRVRSQ